MRAKPATRWLIAAILVGVGACAPVPDPPISGVAAAHTQHAVRAERLVSLMRQLGGLRDERLPKAMDPRLERSQRVEAIAETAREIADSAERIRFPGPQASIDSSKRSEFELRAEALRLRSLELAERAAASTDAQLREQIRAIDETCASCHTGFRR